MILVGIIRASLVIVLLLLASFYRDNRTAAQYLCAGAIVVVVLETVVCMYDHARDTIHKEDLPHSGSSMHHRHADHDMRHYSPIGQSMVAPGVRMGGEGTAGGGDTYISLESTGGMPKNVDWDDIKYITENTDLRKPIGNDPNQVAVIKLRETIWAIFKKIPDNSDKSDKSDKFNINPTEYIVKNPGISASGFTHITDMSKNIANIWGFSITCIRDTAGKVTYTLSRTQTKPNLPQRLAYLCLDGDIKLEVPYREISSEYIIPITVPKMTSETFCCHRITWPVNITNKHVVFLLPSDDPKDVSFTIDALALDQKFVEEALRAANDGTFVMKAKTTAPV